MATGLTTLTLTAAEPEVSLPKLGAVKVDGDLTEWNAAVTVPVRFASYIAQRRPSHTWSGQADCGMELFCGWNDEGLCLAGFVADDDIRADLDGVDLYVDARVGAAFLKSPYSAGSYQILVRPPVGDEAPKMVFGRADGAIAGAQLAVKRVAGGWTFEMVLPWSAFPGFSARSGTCVGLQFAGDDYDGYDGRDRDTAKPLVMSWHAAKALSENPQKLVKFTLCDTLSKGALMELGTVADIGIPAGTGTADTVRISLEMGRTLAGQVRSGTCEIKDVRANNVVAGGSMVLAKPAAPWQESAVGQFDWTLGSAADGMYTIEVTLADAQGASLGVLLRTVALGRFQDGWNGKKAFDPNAANTPFPQSKVLLDQVLFLLPKLGAIKLDGELEEWTGAAAVPLRFASYIARCVTNHTWNGPVDGSMVAFCGWNDDGLCLAGLVSDDDVRNNRPPRDPHCFEEDCVEIFFDGRTGNFMTPPYTKGASHMLLRPPVGGKGPIMQFHAGMPEDIRLAGKLVPGGWTFEIVVPWSYFLLFDPAPGAHVGLQFAMDDYDARDGAAKQPLMMTWQAVTALFTSPQNMMKWTLVETVSKGAITNGGK
jgi:hypothetical protein